MQHIPQYCSNTTVFGVSTWLDRCPVMLIDKSSEQHHCVRRMARVSVDQNLPDVTAYTLPFLFIYNTRGGFACFLLGVFGRSNDVVSELYSIVFFFNRLSRFVLIGPFLFFFSSSSYFPDLTLLVLVSLSLLRCFRASYSTTRQNLVGVVMLERIDLKAEKSNVFSEAEIMKVLQQLSQETACSLHYLT